MRVLSLLGFGTDRAVDLASSSAQALEQNDVVGGVGAGDGEAFAVPRPSEVPDHPVVGEVRGLPRRHGVFRAVIPSAKTTQDCPEM